MKKPSAVIDNERGSLLLIVIMVVAILTISGLYVAHRSSFESDIVRNETIYKDNYFRAESAMNEGCVRVNREHPLNLEYAVPGWIHIGSGGYKGPATVPDAFAGNIRIPDSWIDARSQTSPTLAKPGVAFVPRYFAVYEGVVPGSSLDVDGSRLHQFSVFGIDSQHNSTVIIQSGYKHRFKSM